MPEDSLNLVGTTIAEKYAIESVVGEGGFAIVYRARHLIWKRPVAIKVFKALADVAIAQREKLLQEFIQEGALLADLSERSAAICQARDVGTLTLDAKKGTEWLPYMVLEWLEGATLEKVLFDEKHQGRPTRSVEATLRLLQPVAEALALAHRKGIAHRDIKPANIFLCGDPNEEGCPVKLLDFGIAKVVQDAQKAGGAFTKTSGQVTSFTPSYGAPEQFSRTHGSTGPWTDVFAFALVMVECLTHKEALEGDGFMQIAFASADPAHRPTPRNKGATVTNEVEAVFAKALAVNPGDRYRAMGEFWEALRRAAPSASVPGFKMTDPAPLGSGPVRLSQDGSPRVEAVTGRGADAPALSAPSPATTQPRTPGNKAPAIAAAAVGLLAIGGIGAFFALRPAASRVGGSASASATAPLPSASLSATPGASAVAAKSACPDGMIAIPGGRFFMGSDDESDLPFERPAHNVTLEPYCIDRFEVTTAEYKTCSDDGKCKRAAINNEFGHITKHDREIYDPLCNFRDPVGHAKHPINCVSWEMADAFCKETDRRLPTEAEWEFAARGPDGRKFPWGDEPPAAGRLNACGLECGAWGKEHGVEMPEMYEADDGFATTAPVGSFPLGKSRYGVEDVVGNVWEWVADWYAPYVKDGQVDPKGPPKGTERVIRGGGWNGSAVAWVRPTFRYRADPTTTSHGTGFRCAK